MPSYKLIPTPNDDAKTENPEELVEELSARDSNKEFRRGTIPETLEGLQNDIFWFDYAIEREFEYETLEGEYETKILEKHPIIFLGGEWVAIGNCNKEVEEEILDFIGNNFVPGYSLEVQELEEGTLRQIIEEAPEIVKADLNPSKDTEPEKISGKDRRSLRATDFWQRYEGEPVEKIKVKLPNEDKEVTVGFDKHGIVILYERSLEMKEQVEALQHVATNIISEFAEQQYQKSLTGGN